MREYVHDFFPRKRVLAAAQSKPLVRWKIKRSLALNALPGTPFAELDLSP
jgi:hypothetical protein